jgi:hypothetical protein
MSPEPVPPKAPDLRKLLEPLVSKGVDLVVVGGMAGIAYGSTYPSFDLDVAYSCGRANIGRLAAALVEIGVRLRAGTDDLPFQLDERMFESGANFNFVTRFGDLDVLGDIPGITSYEKLRSSAVEMDIAGIHVRVASLDDLISMKRAANRTKDKLLVLEYVELADERRRAAQ